MNLNEFAKEIHANACAHGWWDEPRPFDELCALMISELSEALEEARAGRPMEWHWDMKRVEDVDGCFVYKKVVTEGFKEGRKPEGIAVEMADCAIRMLDYLGSTEWDINGCLGDALEAMEAEENDDICWAFMDIVTDITSARIYVMRMPYNNFEAEHLCTAILRILRWFKANDLDFEDIARRKHEYNKTRPYKHGKAF